MRTRFVGGWLVLVLALGCRREAPSRAAPDAVRLAPDAPPSVPEGLLGRVGFARPRATAEVVGQRVGLRLPFDLVLAVGAGVPMAVLGAVDTSLPLAACAVERGAAGEVGWLLALTPRSAGEARTALSSRYALTAVAGLGERADERAAARDGGAARRRVTCALVPVADAVAARVVCAGDGASLERAGRWLAWSMRGADAGAADDLVAELAEGAPGRLRARWEAATTAQLAEWEEAASAERRAHAGPPDYGDPEAALAVARRVRDALSEAIGEAHALRVGVRLGDDGAAVTLAGEWPRSGTSALATDAVARAGAGLGGARSLDRWVPPDASVRGWVRTPGEGHRAWWTALVDAAVQVMGARLGDGAAARRTLLAVGEEVGEAAAWGAVTEGEGSEWTLAVSLRDGGVRARGALARLTTEGWARSLRWGGRPLRVTACGAGAWCVALGPGAPAAGARGGATAAAAAPAAEPGMVVLAVRGGTLVAIAGARARASLEGADARVRAGSVGGSSTVDAGVSEGASAGESVAVTMRGGASGGPVSVGYGTVVGPGVTVTATARAVVPWWVLARARERAGSRSPRTTGGGGAGRAAATE